MKKRIVVFASGSGTNTQNIIQYFQQGEVARVVLVLTNNKDAKVLDRSKQLNTKSLYFNKEDLYAADGVLNILRETNPDLIVLAGFLLKFPAHILHEFPNKVINIHPALLPKYGGKGMYGSHVHQAVLEHKEKETGITIHYVNEHYDEGAIIFQATTAVIPSDTAKTIAEKVHQLEYKWLPKVIEKILVSEENDLPLSSHPSEEREGKNYPS
ncbi:phosphoribosylglycinamide formyltransferase [Constantimarinum furrinae]|uniref:Phosphoribosylglycinamide formyltransferase n=1 Tax=Constantimarinum furrinae TaxID=2562285 RepID=A0A7G8PTA7_9FLAO|nr:phosphoribosylglycinamide formyltransferase [Constantimarinum furrinae]QNJ97573.1 phosphoribosylglycinamide formyltransferase [Constantimarinum furrinae]